MVFATLEEIRAKEGANVSSAVTDAMRTAWLLQVESYINVLCRKDFSTGFSEVSERVRSLLTEAATCFCAVYAISYDMSGYTSRIEAENMINILLYRFNKDVDLLEDQKSVTYMVGL